jgi:hypothetical protein
VDESIPMAIGRGMGCRDAGVRDETTMRACSWRYRPKVSISRCDVGMRAGMTVLTAMRCDANGGRVDSYVLGDSVSRLGPVGTVGLRRDSQAGREVKDGEQRGEGEGEDEDPMG